MYISKERKATTLKVEFMRKEYYVGDDLGLNKLLWDYALRLTNDKKCLAKELVEQTLSRIMQRATAYSPETLSFDSWAKMTMLNTFRETFEDADLYELYYLFYKGTLNPFATYNDGMYDLREQIYIMSSLTPLQAAATSLRLNRHTHDIIAKLMNTSVECVKEHIENACNTAMYIWYN